MALFKGVRPWSLDVGGRILAAGEVADLDPADPVVVDLLSRDDITAVQGAVVPAPESPPIPLSQRAPEES